MLRRLNAAGWEPVTHARAEPDSVLVERFGERPDRGLFLTIRNPGAASQRARLTVQLAPLAFRAKTCRG